MREGEYQAGDKRVQYTDQETFQLATDLYQYVEHDYKGSPSVDAVRLEGIIKNLQAGKPLAAEEWNILYDTRRRMGAGFEQWRQSGKEGQGSAVPDGPGRVVESSVIILPTTLMREGYATPSTTKKDKNISAPHLLDSVLHDFAHTRQHVARILEPDVQADPDSIKFNAEHALNHAESGQDHAKKLDQHLAQHPSDPKLWASERQALNDMRAVKESAPFPPPNLRQADPHDEDQELTATTPVKECGTCKMFNSGRCMGYNNIRVGEDWVCDSWEVASDWRQQNAELHAQRPLPSLVTMGEAATFMRLREDSKPQICLDFDGVIYDRSNEPGGSDLAGKLIKGTEEAMKHLAGLFRIVILTARPNTKAVRAWLEGQGLGSFIADVTNIKPSSAAYVDNRALLFKNWPQVVRDLEAGDKSPYSSNVPGGKT